MRKIICLLIISVLMFGCNTNKTGDATSSDSSTMKKDTSTSTTSSGTRGYEFADNKYVDIGKKQLAAFSNADFDTWSNQFSDSIVYSWSGGDSLVGKKAIVNYWKNRRATVVDSVKISMDIWVPLKINQPQQGPDIPGVWLLSWYKVDSKYKNGKRASFWVHQDAHFNSNDQIDRFVNYVDRSVINAASGKK